MSALDEAVAACKGSGVKMPPHLAAWVVAREVEAASFDQARLGQALFELLGGPGPGELASIITRMVHPDTDQRWPPDGKALRDALHGFISSSGRPATAPLVREFIAHAQRQKQRDSGEWQGQGPQLDAAGRLTAVRPHAAPGAEAFEPGTDGGEVLELARDPRQRGQGEWQEPAPYRDEPTPQKGRGPVLAVLALVVLGGAAAAVFMLFPTLQRKIPVSLAPAARALVINSTPGGASVVIEGQVIGTTPYAGDNQWRGHPRLEVKLEGYESFRGTFEGGKDQTISATLKRKK